MISIPVLKDRVSYVKSFQDAQECFSDPTITHIVSCCKLEKPDLPETTKWYCLDIDDYATESISSHFIPVLSFWKDCTKEKGKMMVHCVNGVSRSITILLAMLMFVDPVYTYDVGLDYLREVLGRDDLQPNDGFRQQLISFYQNSLYQNREVEKKKIRCKGCRFDLFTVDDVIEHKNRSKGFSVKKTRKQGKAENRCQSYFISKMDWMGELSSIEGIIHCCKCKMKIGSYKWAGSQCSCGSWVVPSIQILKSKVDYIGET